MNITQRKGFTLIEILIVVAIIAILASVVLVGLGPTQQAGRDARRISDLSEVQNALELFYNKCGFYPGVGAGACTAGSPGSAWGPQGTAGTFSANLVADGIGVSTIPQDPTASKSYGYWYAAGNTTYVIGATLENPNNSVFTNYTAPALPANKLAQGGSAVPPANCTYSQQTPNYCMTL